MKGHNPYAVPQREHRRQGKGGKPGSGKRPESGSSGGEAKAVPGRKMRNKDIDKLMKAEFDKAKREQLEAKRRERLEAKRLKEAVRSDAVAAIQPEFRLKDKYGHRNAVYWCDFSPDGSCLATCSHDMMLATWDLKESPGKRIGNPLSGHSGWVMQVKWSSNGKYLLSCSADKTVRIWNMKHRVLATTMTGHDSMVRGCDWSPDGSRAVSCSSDKSIIIWDTMLAIKRYTNTKSSVPMLKRIFGQPMNTDGHAAEVNRVIFDPRGDQLLSCSNDGTLKRWNAKTGELLRTYRGHEDHVLGCCYNPTGAEFASASHDGTVRVWNSDSGRVRRTLRGHTSIVYDVKYSNNDGGRLLLSGGHDGRIIVWDAKRGFDALHLLGLHRGWILCVGFSHDNLMAASASGDNTTLVHRACHPTRHQKLRTCWFDVKSCLTECVVM